MGYIQDIEKELRAMLDGMDEELIGAVVKFAKEKIYESYLNGRKMIGADKDTNAERKPRKFTRGK